MSSVVAGRLSATGNPGSYNPWIYVGALAYFLFVISSAAEPVTATQAGAFGFQLICWAVGLTVAVKSSSGQLRISNPVLVLLLWSFLYLILPSAYWLKGARLPYVTSADWAKLQWLH